MTDFKGLACLFFFREIDNTGAGLHFSPFLFLGSSHSGSSGERLLVFCCAFLHHPSPCPF